MKFRFYLSLLIAKICSYVLSYIGGGSALPGLISLKICPDFLSFFASSFKNGIILVSGTNGKTTTTTLIKTILESSSFSVLHNHAGSNLLRGIASTVIKASNLNSTLFFDWGIFEVDEATLPQAIKILKPKQILILNLFRDQLDRYGEIDSIANKWKKALITLDRNTEVILNADDPVVAFLGDNLKAKVSYFCLNDPTQKMDSLSHFADSIFCPRCRAQLDYQSIWYSHLGRWICPQCNLQFPQSQLEVTEIKTDSGLSITIKNTENNEINHFSSKLTGLYNASNIAAVILSTQILEIPNDRIKKTISEFKPVFGRNEEFIIEGRTVNLILSKNPTGFTESIRSLQDSQAQNIILVLNDRIADGTDVSWIYDVDFEQLRQFTKNLIVSGNRTEDLALRLKYAGFEQKEIIREKKPRNAIKQGILRTGLRHNLYILATYTAMLEVRKILTGRKLG